MFLLKVLAQLVGDLFTAVNASEQGLCKMPALLVVKAAQRADGCEDVLPYHFAKEQEPSKLGATLDVVDLLGGDPQRDKLGGPRARGCQCHHWALPRGGEENSFATTVGGRMALGLWRNYWD